MMALNCEHRCIQLLTSSIALSKFFTYSPYIFRKGASFCRMSPMRGFWSLRAEVKISKTLRFKFFLYFFFLLTIPPCVSPAQAAGTVGESSRWSRCWRRCPWPPHRGRSCELGPPPSAERRTPDPGGGVWTRTPSPCAEAHWQY